MANLLAHLTLTRGTGQPLTFVLETDADCPTCERAKLGVLGEDLRKTFKIGRA